MANPDALLGWSAARTHRNQWLKWRAAGGIVAGLPELVAAQLGAGPAATPQAQGGPLLAGLSALAAGDLGAAQRLLDGVVESGGDDQAEVGLAQVAIGDLHTLRGDPSAALFAYDLAARSPHARPVAALGHATTLLATGSAPAALDFLRPLRAAHGPDPVLAYYHALALLGRADQVRAHTRAGRRVIISAGQLNACRQLVGELAPAELDDPELRGAAIELAEQVHTGGRWAWRERGTNVGVLAFALAVSLAAVVAGGLAGNVAILVAGALIGAAGVFLFVVTHRRPAWELRAQDAAALITHRGW